MTRIRVPRAIGWTVFVALLLAPLAMTVENDGFPSTDGDAESPGLASVAGLASVDVLTASFLDVATGTNYPDLPHTAVIMKWTEPLRIAFRGIWPEEDRIFANRVLHELARLTDLDIAVVRDGAKETNVVMHHADRSQFPRILRAIGINRKMVALLDRNAACVTLTWYGYDFSLAESHIIITGRDFSPYKRRCIVEELTHSLGLAAHKSHYRPSVLSEDFYLPNRVYWEPYPLSPNDMILIRTLYDRRIAPGMTSDEARPAARFVIRELVRRVNLFGSEALYLR